MGGGATEDMTHKALGNAVTSDANGAAIPGLYAAGECAYVGTNGANPMTVDVVFGGIAGQNAAAYAAK